MTFDPANVALNIPTMIENDTLFDDLDQDKLSECLKHIVLDVDDSLYILKEIQSKYTVSDRFRAIRHMYTDFGEDDKFDSQMFVKFIKAMGKCLHFDIFESISNIFESLFSKNNKSQNNDTNSRPKQNSESGNKYIEMLKQTPKTADSFGKIYKICKKIAEENNNEAMSFAVNEKYVYVTEREFPCYNVFTKAAAKNKIDLIRLLIDSKIDVNSKDSGDYTALMGASREGHDEIVQLLLSVPGIDVNIKDEQKDTALIIAKYNSNHTIAKMLKAHGAH